MKQAREQAFRKASAALLVFVAAFWFSTGLAMAGYSDPDETVQAVQISALTVTLLVSHVIPILTSLLTHVNASATVKQVVTGALSAINGVIVNATVQDGSAWLDKEVVLFAILSFISANVAYIGFWKPHAINDKIAPDKGLGEPKP